MHEKTRMGAGLLPNLIPKLFVLEQEMAFSLSPFLSFFLSLSFSHTLELSRFLCQIPMQSHSLFLGFSDAVVSESSSVPGWILRANYEQSVRESARLVTGRHITLTTCRNQELGFELM